MLLLYKAESSPSFMISLMAWGHRFPRAFWDALSALLSRDFTLSKLIVMLLDWFDSYPSWDWALDFSAVLLWFALSGRWLPVRVLLRELDRWRFLGPLTLLLEGSEALRAAGLMVICPHDFRGAIEVLVMVMFEVVSTPVPPVVPDLLVLSFYWLVSEDWISWFCLVMLPFLENCSFWEDCPAEFEGFCA